jgi:hypothetical protein
VLREKSFREIMKGLKNGSLWFLLDSRNKTTVPKQVDQKQTSGFQNLLMDCTHRSNDSEYTRKLLAG